MGVRWEFGQEVSSIEIQDLKSEIDNNTNSIKEKLSINEFNTFKSQNTQAISQGDTQTLEKSKTYTNELVKLQLVTKDRNTSITSFTNTGKTLDGLEIWEGVMVFSASGEANLVNGCTILLGAYLYNIDQNRFIAPESVSLRVQNNYQIRASFPNTAANYRLYFVGIKG